MLNKYHITFLSSNYGSPKRKKKKNRKEEEKKPQ